MMHIASRALVENKKWQKRENTFLVHVFFRVQPKTIYARQKENALILNVLGERRKMNGETSVCLCVRVWLCCHEKLDEFQVA